MRFICCLCVLLTFLNFKVSAQKEANFWYFASRAGLDFNSGTPVQVPNGEIIGNSEGCTTVSDATGNLLFYSDGGTVWNRNHVPIGAGLMGHLNSTQAVVAVPKPNSTTIYYLFTTDAIENNMTNGLRYSILDISLAGGLGAITQKNVLMETPVTENLTITKHANNVDYWVISHRWNSDAFVAYLLTANGVNATPVVSNAGVTVSGSRLNAAGNIKASPQGNKLAHSVRELSVFQLLDFNNTTGVLSNAVVSPPIYAIPYGVEFSPDGTKLYGTEIGGINNYNVYQFNLAAPNVFASGLVIGTSQWLTSGIQNGPDGKIYCAQRGNRNLGVINNPNALGTACNYVSSGFALGQSAWFCLPNFPTNLFIKTEKPAFESSNGCFGESISFSFPGYQSGGAVSWNFGDPNSGALNTASLANPTHTFSAPGTYQVSLTVTSGGSPVVNMKKVIVKPVPVVDLGKDTILCLGQTLLLGKAPVAGLAYKWQDGSTNATYLVTRTGTYGLEINQNGCSATDSIRVTFIDGAYIGLGPDTVICDEETYLLGKPAIPGLNYKWQDGSTNATFLVSQPGTYSLEVSKDNCPPVKDEIMIGFQDCSLFIPNVITANNDGLNDAFKVRGLVSEEHQLRIFSRWGTLVYETNSYKNDWNAKDTSDGIFYYLLKHNQTGKIYKGWLEVVK
jgi:gliding motility-associated-like protein